MKNILFATTALVATAGIASADVTFSGSGEAGMYRTEAADAVAGRSTTTLDNVSVTAADAATAAETATQDLVQFVDGVLTTTKAGGDLDDIVANAAAAADAADGDLAIAKENVAIAKEALRVAEANVLADDFAAQNATDDLIDLVAARKADLARAEAVLANLTGSEAVAAGDMTAYSGYQADVTLSAETDSGIKFTMGFDLEAGLMADQDDDREMDTKDGSIANSTLTMEVNGYTLVIGQDEIDDLYDDSQNGDISLSGAMGDLSFTVVHDFEDSVAGSAAKFAAADDTDGVAGEADYVNATFTDAVEADNNGTSLSLGYTMGAATLGLVSTTANDRDNSATKVSLDYTVSETLSFNVAYDTQGDRDEIASASVTYAIDALTITASYADDKDHAGNTNEGGKASANLKVGYTQGPISATFATDESDAWWINTKYDLGGGAAAFATVDHTDFAVAGLSFAF